MRTPAHAGPAPGHRRLAAAAVVAVVAALVAANGSAASAAAAAAVDWTPFGPPAGLVATLALDSAGNVLTSTAASGVYRSNDLGATWQLSSQGMGTETARALAVDASSGQQVAVTTTGVFSRPGTGAAWQLLARTNVFGSPGTLGDALALSPGATTPSWFLARGRRVFHSADGGRSWRQALATQDEVASILVDPHDPRSVFVGTDGSDEQGALLHSGDEGATWESITAAEPLPSNPGILPFLDGVASLAAIATRPATLFAVASSALLRSTDGGATWQLISDLPTPPGAQLFVQSIAAGPGPGAKLYLLYEAFEGSTGAQLFGALVSADLGTSWKRLDRSGLAAGDHLAVQPGTGNLLALQVDRIAIGRGQGQRWSAARLGDQFCGGPSGGEARLAFSAGGRRAVMLVGGRLFVGTDGGVRLVAVGPDSEPDGECARFRDLAVDAASGTWFALSDRAVYSSTDGVRWQPQPADGLANFDPSSFTLAALGGNRLLAGTCGIARSDDGGRTWVETFPCEDSSGGVNLVRRFVVAPEDPERVFALMISAQATGFPGRTQFVEVSENAGRSWVRLGLAADALAIDGPSRTPLLWALGGQGLFRSGDLGNRWMKVGTFSTGADPLTDAYLGTRVDLETDPHDPSVLYAAKWDGFWRSGDAGRTFTPMNEGLQAENLRLVRILVDPTGARRLYAAGLSLFTSPNE